jgi:hypothetical protein
MENVQRFFHCELCSSSKSKRAVEDWVALHIKAINIPQEDRNNAAITELRHHQMASEHEFVKKPSILGVVLCWQCSAFQNGISYATMHRLKQSVRQGDTDWHHNGKSQGHHVHVKQKAVVTFITELQTNFGEAHPDKTKIELPPDTKSNLYLDFSQSHESKKCAGCTYEYFCTIWRTDFPDLILPKNPRWVSTYATWYHLGI